MATAWTKAAELAIKFLDSDKAIDVAQTAGPLLVEVGRHSAAAQLYMGVEMIKEAIDAFISAQEWGKAKKVAKELEPRLEPYVDQRYKVCSYALNKVLGIKNETLSKIGQ